MAVVNFSPIFNGYQAFSLAGLPLTFGTIDTFVAGSSTPLATYTTAAGNIANANPIVLLADGRPPQEIWLIQGSAYRFVLKDFLGNQIGTHEDIIGIEASGGTGSLRVQLADPTSVSNGSGMVGYGDSLSYGTGTVGAEFRARSKVVASIAALRLQLKTGTPNVFVTGYYATNKDGSGHFYYDSTDTTSADNGGTIIVTADGGRWKRIFAGPMDTSWWGTVADGNASTGAGTDNRTAFQAALTYANTVAGMLHTKQGIYAVSDQLTVGTNVRWSGDGMYRTVITTPATFSNSDGLIKANGVGGPPTIIENMAVLCPGAAGFGVGINAAANAVVLRHIWGGGFYATFLLSGTDNTATDVWADVSTSAGIGFLITNGGNTLTDFHTFNCYQGLFVDASAYWTGTEPDLGLIISNGDIIQSGFSGITLNKALNTIVSNVKIHSPTNVSKFTRDFVTITDGTNITLDNVQGTFSATVSASNIGFRQTGNTDNLKVVNCSATGSLTGMTLSNAVSSTIANNTFRNCAAWGADINGSNLGLVFKGNQASSCGTTNVSGFGGFNFTNAATSRAWIIANNHASDTGTQTQFGFKLTANVTATSKINLIGNAVSNTTTPYSLGGTVANITQTANI